LRPEDVLARRSTASAAGDDAADTHQPKREAGFGRLLDVRVDIAAERRAGGDRKMIEHQSRRSVLVPAEELVDGSNQEDDADDREEHRETDRPGGNFAGARHEKADRKRNGVPDDREDEERDTGGRSAIDDDPLLERARVRLRTTQRVKRHGREAEREDRKCEAGDHRDEPLLRPRAA
jgi:hypothetical protein